MIETILELKINTHEKIKLLCCFNLLGFTNTRVNQSFIFTVNE